MEVERLQEQAGLLADPLPLLERKREWLAELEQEVSTAAASTARDEPVSTQESTEENLTRRLSLAASRWYAASSSSSAVSPEST